MTNLQKESNKLTNKKVSFLKHLPKTTMQIDPSGNYTEVEIKAIEFGAVYWMERRPWEAVDRSREANRYYRDYGDILDSDGMPRIYSFRVARRVVIVDRKQVNMTVKVCKSKSNSSVYRNIETPSGWRGYLRGHGQSEVGQSCEGRAPRMSDSNMPNPEIENIRDLIFADHMADLDFSSYDDAEDYNEDNNEDNNDY